MMLKEMKEVIEIFEKEDVDLSRAYLESNHDIIYLPWHEETGDVADKLSKLECHWCEEYECWASF